ncbi:MAG: NB-ARC domain-containing protein [Firmicutes bacterium]|nr:NB-ARC domain-containing protein [Bacillota bacterium]
MKILPKLIDTFLGREEELKRLRKFFPSHHLFIIKGIGGIGKTTLALAFLEKLKKEKLEKKIFWIECLEGWRLENFFFEIDSWLRSTGEESFSSWLKGSKTDLKEKTLFLINILNKKKFILFIDDFHLLQDKNIQLFLNLLHTYLNSHIIFTSREDIPASHFEKLDIFEEKLEGLTLEAATSLLINLLELHKRTPKPDNESLLKIVKKISGHPLLLKLVASLIIAKSLDIEKIVSGGTLREIQDYIFSNILKNTSHEEQKILDLLALSAIPIPESSVKTILKIKNAEETISSLERKSLLQRDDSGSISIHNLIARYLEEDMSDDLKRMLHRKLGEYFDKTGLQQEAFSHFLEGSEPLKASKILAGSAQTMYFHGKCELLIEDSNRLEKVLPEINPWILVEKANALFVLGSWKESLAILKKVGTLTTDQALLAEALSSIAGIYFNTGNMGESFAFYKKSLKLSELSSASSIATKCLNNLALICGLKGEVNLGRKYLKRSLEISSRENNKYRLAYALRIKGIIHNIAGEYNEALQAAMEALKLTSDVYLALDMRIVIGDAYFCLGKLAEAEAVFEKNLHDAKKLGDTLSMGFNLLRLGEIASERGEYSEAKEAFNAASRIYIEHENFLNNAIAHYWLALNFIDEDKEETAITLLEKSLIIARECSHYNLEAEILLKLSEIYLNKGDFDKASDFSNSAFSLLEKLELPKLKADAHLYMAEIALRNHNETEAKEHVENCFVILNKVKNLKSHNYEILRDAQDDSEVFRPQNKYPEKFFKGYFLLSIISSSDKPEKIRYDNEAHKLLKNLSGSKKRDAERFIKRLRSVVSRKFLICLNNRKYSGDEKEVESLRANKDSHEFFMDIPGEQLFIKNIGEIDIFRKNLLTALLSFLVLNAGKGFSSEELFSSVWGYKFDGKSSANDLRKNISCLRALIEPDRSNPRFIKHSKAIGIEKGKYYFEKNTIFCSINELTP